MRLELHINGSFFSSVAIDEMEIEPPICFFEFNRQNRVSRNEQKLIDLTRVMKADFYKQLGRAMSYEIYFVVESNFEKEN